jgi:hypothetical protein
MKRLFTLLTSFALIANASAQTIWNTGSFTFTKTVAFQQDCITPSVCLTRGSNSVIYNEVTENYLDGDGNCSWTPGNTTWAYGNIANWNTLTYQNLYTLNNCTPPSMVNQPMVLHIMPADIYLQLTFSLWAGGGTGGNFTYTRTTGPAPLPIHLTAFNVEQKNNNCVLSWTTESEVNNKGFDLERSADGKTFESIAYIPASAALNTTNSYNFTDESPYNGLNYYRLKQVDLNGDVTYSWVVKTSIKSGNINIYPNPSTNVVNIKSSNGFISWKLANNLGVIVKAGTSTDKEIYIRNLPSGMYMLTIIDNEHNVLVKRITKL